MIQNLYHRLVLINVKKTGEGEGSSGDGPTPGGSESNTDGSFGSGDAGQQRPGAGLGKCCVKTMWQLNTADSVITTKY